MPNAHVAAAAPGLPTYTFDDAVSDIGHLEQLLDAIVETVIDLPRGGDRDGDLSRLDAFAWIGRDLAKRIGSDLASIPGGGRHAR